MSKRTEVPSSNVHIVKEAEKVFGSSEKAERWLNQKNLVLGMTPLEALATDNGTHEVMKILNAIGYGGIV